MDGEGLVARLEELRAAYYTAQSWAYGAREELQEAQRLESASDPTHSGPAWRGRMRMYEVRAEWAEQLAEQARAEYEECLQHLRPFNMGGALGGYPVT